MKQFQNKLSKPDNLLDLEDIEKNNSFILLYQQPPYQGHNSILQQGLQLPPQTVQAWEVDQIDRRSFQGENAVNMARRILYNDQTTQEGYYAN